MENDKLAKLVDAIIVAAVAMGEHPYGIVNSLAGLISDDDARKAFCTETQEELLRRANTLPWSF